jgi:hypothetical protein
MPGIFPSDAIILTAVELMIEDMRKNPWLISHMLEDLTASSYLSKKYGQKQVDACKEWLANNQIDIYMRPRDDRDRLPCITITLNSSKEKLDMKHMADRSTFKRVLYPNEIGKPIPYVIKPFEPTNYDSSTGLIDIPTSIDLSGVVAKMILVNPSNGEGFIIEGVVPGGILIGPNQNIVGTQFGIVPQFQYYEARIEHSFFEESYDIACHAHGDVQTVLWLWSITKYALLRYRESLFEANGFAESYVTSGPPDLNADWTTDGGEKAYTRAISITGQVENTWIKAPHRIIETVVMKENVDCDSYIGGIRIISNLNPPGFMDLKTETWSTIEDEE